MHLVYGSIKLRIIWVSLLTECVWVTATGHGKQRNEEVHAAVASANLAHTEGGVSYAPPLEPDP